MLLATLLSFHIFANDAEQCSLSDNSQSTNDTQITDQDEVTAKTTEHKVGTTAEISEHKCDTTEEKPTNKEADTTEEKSASKEADRGFNPCLINNKLPVCINNENPDSE